MNDNEVKKRQWLNQIAKEVLDLDTLETRNSDSLDFHDTAVWNIKRALEEAYEAGQSQAALDVAASLFGL